MNLISIIIPLYNATSYIEESVNSVIYQTYKNWELIVVDDGSTDNSLDLVITLSKIDARIQIIKQQNFGVSIARNNGISEAKGDYIFFLDADDIWRKNNLELKIQFLEENKKIDWLFGAINLVDENSKELNVTLKGNSNNILKSLLLWNGDVITTPSTITIRKKCLKTVSFDENLSTAADQDFAIQLASKYKGGYAATPTVNYRVLTNSMSRNIHLMEKDHIRVFKKANKNKLFKSFIFKQQCYSNLYWILAGSWWKDGGNKIKGMRFIVLAMVTNPFSIFRFINK
ncbi:MAG: glycosyltransferase [Flavobacteriales bacterium]|nr:glycosyltransferase [Flavobacteriales bacterium]